MLRVTALALQRGFTIDTGLLAAHVQRLKALDAAIDREDTKSLQSGRGVLHASLTNSGDAAFASAWFLVNYAEHPNHRDTQVAASARLLARMQLDDGSWRYGPPRVPIESSDFNVTASAVRVLQAFANTDRKEDVEHRISRAASWLRSATPLTTDDKAFQLFGLKWTHATPRLVAKAADILRREQNGDGGWAQLRGLNSDAYATGLVLVALHEAADVRATDPAYQRGVEYLLRTQDVDGSWLVHKRAVAMNGYFESGFPHGKFQFISYAGTAWATMAPSARRRRRVDEGLIGTAVECRPSRTRPVRDAAGRQDNTVSAMLASNLESTRREPV